jgi:hypothetical protein
MSVQAAHADLKVRNGVCLNRMGKRNADQAAADCAFRATLGSIPD